MTQDLREQIARALHHWDVCTDRGNIRIGPGSIAKCVCDEHDRCQENWKGYDYKAGADAVLEVLRSYDEFIIPLKSPAQSVTHAESEEKP